jgi:adenylate cyclase
VAGVIGRKKFIYDIWGDTVNTASRMESHGAPNCILISKATHDLIRDKFICAPKGEIEVKDKGVMEVWYLLGNKMRGTSDFTITTTSD